MLDVSLQSSGPAVLPESLQPIERDPLNGAVVGIRRAGSTVPNGGSRMRCVGSVRKEISPEVICAIVHGKRLFWTGSPFETSGARSRMNHRKIDVGTGSVRANHQLRSCSYPVMSAAVT